MIEGALISRPVVSRKGIFFWLLRCLVKVRYTFFLTTVLLGWRIGSVSGIAIWIVVSFAVVLLHELGHALAARWYRQNPEIELYAMGGLTRWAWVDAMKWHDRMLISLAGPGSGFLLAGVLLLAEPPMAVLGDSRALYLARWYFLWGTLAWGAFNLLPLLPLDGGQALAAFLEHRKGGDAGRLLARKVSIATGAIGFVACILLQHTYPALLCGILAYDNYQRMRGMPGFRFPA